MNIFKSRVNNTHLKKKYVQIQMGDQGGDQIRLDKYTKLELRILHTKILEVLNVRSLAFV